MAKKKIPLEEQILAVDREMEQTRETAKGIIQTKGSAGAGKAAAGTKAIVGLYEGTAYFDGGCLSKADSGKCLKNHLAFGM